MPIYFFAEDVPLPIQDKTLVRNWIQEVASREGKSIGQINYIFCSDAYLLTLNQKFLDHDTYTDIITFDSSKWPKISGELYISTERIEENALVLSTSYAQELQRVMIHGILHLCGYKDKSPADEQLMRQKENEALVLIEAR